MTDNGFSTSSHPQQGYDVQDTQYQSPRNPTPSVLPSSKVAVWTLRPPDEIEQEPQRSHHRSSKHHNERVLSGTDPRTLVRDDDLVAGGKYRAICKLFMTLEGSGKEWMGTGFLIDPRTVVTAGHNVRNPRDPVDRKTPIQHATRVQCFLGHTSIEGRSFDPATVRNAYHIAVGWDFYRSKKNERRYSANDLAVLTLDEPFDADQVIPMCFPPEAFQVKFKAPMTVVGYPKDLDEEGRYMYEGTGSGSIYQDGYSKKRLRYRIDTFDGQSGSPVLLQAGEEYQQMVIGVHVQSTQGDPYNYGTVLNARGNYIIDLTTALQVQAGDQIDGVGLLPLEGGTSSIRDLHEIRIHYGGDS